MFYDILREFFKKYTEDRIFKTYVIKVAPRVEKTEVFRKCQNFADRTYFASCIMRKHYFLL